MQGVACIFWNDSDAYGVSLFSTHILTFLAKEYVHKGTYGDQFSVMVGEWMDGNSEPCYWLAARARGVMLRVKDIRELRTEATTSAKKNSRLEQRRAASLLAGAYENDPTTGENSPSPMLSLLQQWAHTVQKEPTKANLYLGLTTVSAYKFIGRTHPEVALDGIDAFFDKLDTSRSDEFWKPLFAAYISTYTSLLWSGHMRTVLSKLAAMAERLIFTWSMPKTLDFATLVRRRDIGIEGTIESFLLVTAATGQVLPPDIDSTGYSQPLSTEKIVVPDPDQRDLCLSAIITYDPMREHLKALLCATIIASYSHKSYFLQTAFDQLHQWGEIVCQIYEQENNEPSIRLYHAFILFMVDIYSSLKSWRQQQMQNGSRAPGVDRAYQVQLMRWQREKHSQQHAINMLARDVLYRL